MSVATLLGAFALRPRGTEGVARRFMFANGLLIPFLVLQMYWHSLIWIAALWAVTFPGAALALALMFRRDAASGRATIATRARPAPVALVEN